MAVSRPVKAAFGVPAGPAAPGLDRPGRSAERAAGGGPVV